MGYYMRYISSDANDITFAWLDEILRKLDREYSIEHGTGRKLAELRYAGNLYGDIEINRPGDGLFDDEMKELLDGIGGFTAPGKGVVEETLTKARTLVALQVLIAGKGY